MDDEREFYRWTQDERGRADYPPLIFMPRGDALTPLEQAANVAGALLHGFVEAIGGLPWDELPAQPEDSAVAETLVELSGLSIDMLKAGLMYLRTEGYHLKHQAYGEEIEIWPVSDPSLYEVED